MKEYFRKCIECRNWFRTENVKEHFCSERCRIKEAARVITIISFQKL